MAGKLMRPSQLATPAFLMNFPHTVSNAVPNNVLMTNRRPYNYQRAFRQWLQLYNKLAEEALVYLLPHDNIEYQDLTYVANIGALLPHADDTILLSNFRSEPRRGEEQIGDDFFQKIGYWTRRPPHFWEGEADLKWIRDNLYVGGHGIRSDINAYNWMSELLGMDIIPIGMTDERLYHLDCLFFPLDGENALVATSVISKADVKALEAHVSITDIPPEYIYDGWTNAVRLHGKLFLNVPPSRDSQDALADFVANLGLEPVMVNLGEFDKSGADLSCLCMHLNFNGRK